MNHWTIRLCVLCLLIGPAAAALMYGCASSAPRGTTADQKMPVTAAPTADANARGGIARGDAAFNPAATAQTAAPGEELWVIEKPQLQTKSGQNRIEQQETAVDVFGDATLREQQTATVRPQAQQADTASSDLIPGSGQLVAKLPDQKLIPIPLQHTDVDASIAGYVATVHVTQQYKNPYAEKIEAVYVFPLPENAAVTEFLMTIGGRRIRGIIREREEAKQIYERARAQGYVASLLTQERPNIFTQSIANIEPGKRIDVDIKYFHTLQYVDGWYEYVFPMMVGPRFNPPGTTNGIGAAGRGDRGASGQTTEVQYLKPGERSGHDIALSVELDAGVIVEQLQSVNHDIVTQLAGGKATTTPKQQPIVHPAGSYSKDPNAERWMVKLADGDRIPNKDFVLRYKVAGKQVKSALMAQRDEKGTGGWFTLMLFPPESLEDLPRKPLEMVFTLDVSGSMAGRPIEQAKAAVTYALTHMRPDDTFNVIRFAGAAEQMSPRALPATPQNTRAALGYIQSMNAGGGTMMIEGIRKSLQVTPNPERLRFVAFLTDGFIGNEQEILAEIHNLRGPSRIFSFGVGSSTNRYLLDGMARFGQGCCAYLTLNDDASKVMGDYFERISHPALTDLSIDWGGMKVSDVYPSKLPDLFVGRPVTITGRYVGRADAATVKVRGKVGGEVREIALNVNAAGAANQHKGIAPVWARAKIADLVSRATFEHNDNDIPGDIKQTALEYSLVSAYTSFVAVDSSARTAGDHGTTVAVPVPVPDGVRYETTVPER